VTGTVGTAISNLAPTITGTVTNYSISPELPAGLSISSSTGVISGTPTDVASTATYTITASNSGGDTTTTISVTVNSAGAIFDTAYPGRSLSEVAPNGLTYLMNYAFGGSYSNVPKLPVQDVTDRSKLTLIAYVRTNDSGVGGVLSVKGQTNNGLSNWSTNSFGPSSIPTDQSDAPIGTQKQIFSVSNSGDRLFLRLKVTK
jgi:hypothetical protein